MLNRIKGMLKNKNKQKFDHLMRVANDIQSRNPRALPDFLNIVLRPLQAEGNLAVAERGTGAISSANFFFFGKFIFDYLYGSDGELLGNYLNAEEYELSLSYHIIFTRPWNLERYVCNLSYIGRHKALDESCNWRQDNNHDVEVWLPWGIGFVCSGNHSILAGIAASEGYIIPSSVIDYSYLFKEIYSDGVWWFDHKSGRKIQKVTHYRIAAAFEIGRLMNRDIYTAEALMKKQL